MCSSSDMGGTAVDGVFGGLDSGDGTTSVQPAATVQMWEGACPRWRCFSQCLWRLSRRYRAQAPSHIFGCVRAVTWGTPLSMLFSVGLTPVMRLLLSNLLPRSKCGRGLAPDGGVSANASGD